ncbi:MAG: YhcH/YjgK/YiaL family protein [Nitrospirae bacterium]|nr:YhcH/YjgK/YiaL family protein [Nitrospirota bacterium]MBI3378840.1 YhcH/YjgK/YiaL family protein [Nitrospirota bacterium]
MIADRIENKWIYFNEGTRLYEGFRFITEVFNQDTPDGKYEINGSEIYAMVQSYTTDLPENKKLESHRRYIDIQYIVSGKEAIGWLPTEGLKVMTPYSEENDVIFYHSAEGMSQLVLTPGMFAVFYPSDAHRPGCFLDKAEQVRKIVVKVKI